MTIQHIINKCKNFGVKTKKLSDLRSVKFIQISITLYLFSKRVKMLSKGSAQLPSREVMWDDINGKRQKMAARYVASTRHTIQVDFISFMDEVAEEIGCKPDIGTFV